MSGHGKGSQWERDLARSLSLWVTGGESKDAFWRTRASGGWATTRRKAGGRKGAFQAGDIGLSDPECQSAIGFLAHFLVEAKFLKKLEMWPWAEGWRVLGRFYQKAKEEGQSEGRKPILVVKVNFFRPLVLLGSDDVDFLLGQEREWEMGEITLYKPRCCLCFFPLESLLLQDVRELPWYLGKASPSSQFTKTEGRTRCPRI